jgi:hypothetical protein
MAYIIVCLHFYVPPFIYETYIQNETDPLNFKKFSCPNFSRNAKLKIWNCNKTRPELRDKDPESHLKKLIILKTEHKTRTNLGNENKKIDNLYTIKGRNLNNIKVA